MRDGKMVRKKKIVNAAGAWAGWVAEKAGAASVPLTAYRRHLYFTKREAASRSRWPFVWDVSHDFYFRPMGRTLMFSPCDKTPELSGDRREKADPAVRKILYQKLRAFSGALAGLRMDEVQSGCAR